jgi:flagellar M-ring protein FliF
VRGIAQLVASSVPGLQLGKVTITGASGQLLWPAAGGGGGAGGGGEVQEAEQRYDQTMEASLDAMLAQTLGAGKAQVLVYANMNVDQTTKEALEYAKTGTPTQQSKSTETLTGSGSGAGGVTGTANLTTAATGAGGKSNFKHETTTSSLGVSKTVTHSTIAPGTVESQHVSVLLDKSVPAGSLPAIREAITNAAGIQTKRGDTISIGQVAFAKSSTTAPAASPLADAKYVLLGLGAIIFLFFTTRTLRKRERETIDEPVWLRELEVPMRLSELERETAVRPAPAMAGVASGNGGGGSAGEPPLTGASARKQVEQLVDSNPDRVAQQLRSWIQEG